MFNQGMVPKTMTTLAQRSTGNWSQMAYTVGSSDLW